MKDRNIFLKNNYKLKEIFNHFDVESIDNLTACNIPTI